MLKLLHPLACRSVTEADFVTAVTQILARTRLSSLISSLSAPSKLPMGQKKVPQAGDAPEIAQSLSNLLLQKTSKPDAIDTELDSIFKTSVRCAHQRSTGYKLTIHIHDIGQTFRSTSPPTAPRYSTRSYFHRPGTQH